MDGHCGVRHVVHHADIEDGEGAELKFDLDETHAEHALYGQHDAVDLETVKKAPALQGTNAARSDQS